MREIRQNLPCDYRLRRAIGNSRSVRFRHRQSGEKSTLMTGDGGNRLTEQQAHCSIRVIWSGFHLQRLYCGSELRNIPNSALLIALLIQRWACLGSMDNILVTKPKHVILHCDHFQPPANGWISESLPGRLAKFIRIHGLPWQAKLAPRWGGGRFCSPSPFGFSRQFKNGARHWHETSIALPGINLRSSIKNQKMGLVIL